MVIGAFSFLSHECVRLWLNKWLKRAHIAAGGAKRTFDSPGFVKALTAWHGVITLGDPTPRGIKRFVNRVRLFAMREHAVYNDKAEASWTTLDSVRHELRGGSADRDTAGRRHAGRIGGVTSRGRAIAGDAYPGESI